MSRRCVILCLLVGAFFLFRPGASQAEEFRVMLYNESFPPYFFAKNDARTGIVKDICTALGKQTGDTFVYQYLPYVRAMLMFDEGEIDVEVMSNPVWRQHRAVPGEFTVAHGKSVNVVLFRAGKKKTVTSPRDLEGESVGVIKGYQYPAFDQAFEAGTIKAIPGRDELHLLEMLRHDRLDQILINEAQARYWMAQNPAYSDFELGYVFSEKEMRMRLHPAKKDALPRFDRAIQQLLDSGAIAEIYARYMRK